MCCNNLRKIEKKDEWILLLFFLIILNHFLVDVLKKKSDGKICNTIQIVNLVVCIMFV